MDSPSNHPWDVVEKIPGIPMEPQLDACPHCGGEVYHVRLAVSGTIRENHRFDGHRTDNTDMWSYLKTVQRPTIYCSECERPIAMAKTS